MIDGLSSLAGCVLDTRYLSPQGKCPVPKQSIVSGFNPMATNAKQIIDGAMDGKEALRLGRRFKLLHLAYPLPSGLMGNLGPIVLPLLIVVYHIGQPFFACGAAITPQLIGNDSTQCVTQAL